jgi:hypothetical protein
LRIPLGVAFALHAAALAFAARLDHASVAPLLVEPIELWEAPPAPASAPISASMATPQVESPRPTSTHASPGGAGKGRASASFEQPGRRGSPTSANLDGISAAAFLNALEDAAGAPLPKTSEEIHMVNPHVRLGSLAGGNADSGFGEGDGGAGRVGGARKGTGWGESWDHVAAATPHTREEATEIANETTLPRATIAAVVGRSRARFKACYDDGNRREAGLAGRLTVRFLIDPKGTVVVAKDGGTTIADPAVIRCVLAVFSTMSFPTRAESVSIWATQVIAFPAD